MTRSTPPLELETLWYWQAAHATRTPCASASLIQTSATFLRQCAARQTGTLGRLAGREALRLAADAPVAHTPESAA